MTKIAETLQEFSSLLLPHDLEQLRIRLEGVDREGRVRLFEKIRPGIETLEDQRNEALDAIERIGAEIERWWTNEWITMPANEAAHMEEIISALKDLGASGRCTVCGDRNGVQHVKHIDHPFTPRERT